MSTIIHREDCGSHEKIDKKKSVPCDKIITYYNKIKYIEEKVLSPLNKSTICNKLQAQLTKSSTS